MYCRYCGAELTDEVHVCPNRANEPIVESVSKKKWSVLSIIGFLRQFIGICNMVNTLRLFVGC